MNKYETARLLVDWEKATTVFTFAYQYAQSLLQPYRFIRELNAFVIGGYAVTCAMLESPPRLWISARNYQEPHNPGLIGQVVGDVVNFLINDQHVSRDHLRVKTNTSQALGDFAKPSDPPDYISNLIEAKYVLAFPK